MRVSIPVGAYLIIDAGEGGLMRVVVSGCEGLEGARVAVLGSDGSVTYAAIRACGEGEAPIREVRGEAFTTPVPKGGGLVTSSSGHALTPAPPSLGRVRRFEHHHLAHVLGFALGRSGGEDVEGVWGEYPGDAVRHAPKALLRRVGGVGAVLWGVALGGQADVEEFVSGLALGIGGGGVRLRLGRDSLQALTLLLRRGGVRHKVVGGEAVIESLMDVLVPHRGPGNVWVEPVELGPEAVGEVVTLEVGSDHPLITGYVGWYLSGVRG